MSHSHERQSDSQTWAPELEQLLGTYYGLGIAPRDFSILLVTPSDSVEQREPPAPHLSAEVQRRVQSLGQAPPEMTAGSIARKL